MVRLGTRNGPYMSLVTYHCKTFSVELIDAWIMLVSPRIVINVIIERKERETKHLHSSTRPLKI
jgi:hypothetical protein